MVYHIPRTTSTNLYIMSPSLEPNSPNTVGEESQNHNHDSQSLTWRNIEIDERRAVALKKVIKEIVESTDNLPDQIIEAAKALSEVSDGIKAITISFCLLARITNPLLFSGKMTTRPISSGL